MRVVGFVTLCLLGVFPLSSLAQEKDYSKGWEYEGGFFYTKDGRTWIELSCVIYNTYEGKPLEYKEVKRTEEYVELYSASRKESVRLFAAEMERRKDGKDKWSPSEKGRWRRLAE